MEKSLINKEYRLKKFAGQGGWTYAEIPEVLQNKNTPFGWVRVKGSIDGFELKQYKLAPMGNGRLFLPVKAEIRKKIKKEAGDTVRVILYAGDAPKEIMEELKLCFENEPKAVYTAFLLLAETERNTYVNWIYDAKSEEAKADRIVEMMARLNRDSV